VSYLENMLSLLMKPIPHRVVRPPRKKEALSAKSLEDAEKMEPTQD
jgi:hypothetical protein